MVFAHCGTVRLGRGLVVYLLMEEVRASLAELILSEMLKDGTYPSVPSTSTYSQVLSSPAFPGLFLFPMPSDLEGFKAARLTHTKVCMANKPTICSMDFSTLKCFYLKGCPGGSVG